MISKNISSTSPDFFLGANTPNGFFSLFDELYAPKEGRRLFILTGGPGTGKSSVMKRAAATADRLGVYCEKIHCSSDPESLDAVIFPGLKISIADGTLPHAIAPRFPGVCEKTVDLGQFRDDSKLNEDREAIIEKTLENSAEHKKCTGFLRAAAIVSADTDMIVTGGTDFCKLENFTEHLGSSIFKSESSEKGKVKKRLLSAVTPEGEKVFYDTFDLMCEKKIIFEDNYGVCAKYILRKLSEKAVNSGFSVIECPCVTDSESIEHLMVPELSLGFFTSNRFHPYEGSRYKTVRCSRFCSGDVMKKYHNRIAFNMRAKEEFLNEAAQKMKNAKQIHDELEGYYTAAMNFCGVREKTEDLIREIFG